MKTTGEETNALVLIASGSAKKVTPEICGKLYGKGLVSGDMLTEAGKAHLRTIAAAMTAAPSKRTYRVLSPVVKDGRTREPGATFEACPAGVHIQRWLGKGWVVAI